MDRRAFFGLTASAAAAGLVAGATKIRAAMIGTAHGHAASKARALRQLAEYDFAGVCRVHPDEPDTHEAFAGLARLPVDEVLKDPSIEMVAIETRVDRNLDWAERAVAAGKFVHLDKPPSGNLKRLQTLFDEARRRNRVVQLGYQWRYHPAMQAAIEAARKGWLGQVYSMQARIDKPLAVDERKQLAKFRGGIMFEEGCHLIDRAVDLFQKPKRVTGYMQHASATLDDGLADNTLAILEYDRVLVEISMASFQPHGNLYRLFELAGTNGKASVQPYASSRLMVDLKDAAGPYQAGAQVLEPPEPPGPAYAPDFREMARIIREGAKPLYSVEHDLIVHDTLLRACGMS